MSLTATEPASTDSVLVDPVGAALQLAATRLGASCLLEARNGTVISHALHGNPEVAFTSAVLERRSAPLHAAAQRRRTAAVLPGGALMCVSLSGRRTALVAPVVVGDIALGWLWVFRATAAGNGVEEVAQAAHQVARAACAVAAPEDRTILTALHEGRSATAAVPVELSAERLWVAACASDAPPRTVGGMLQLAINGGQHQMAMSVAVGERLVYLVIGTAATCAPSAVQQAVEAVLARAGAVEVAAALSEPVAHTGELPAARAQADVAVGVGVAGRCLQLTQARSRVVLDRLCAAVADLPDLGPDPLLPLLKYDADRHGNLSRTLLAWLDCNSDAVQAAEHLGMPQNTLRYRVARAQQLLLVDLSLPAARIEIHLRLRAALQQNRQPTPEQVAGGAARPCRS